MSVRNNEERLGAAPNEDSPILSQNLQDPLNFVVPTMHVDLPSKGRYYAEGHPLYEQDSLEIRFMTAKDEDILTSPNLIKKRIVLDRLAQSLILNKKIRVEDILLGDKNAILIQARISGYGSYYNAKVLCPSCGEEQEEEFDLEECISMDYGEEEVENTNFVGDSLFKIVLPNTKAECVVKLFRGKEEKEVLKNFDKKSKESNNLTHQLKLMIQSVNGYEDKKVIDYFVDNMPISDSRTLRNVYDKVNPNTSLIAKFQCDDCGHCEDLEVPLTTDFFWPK